MATTKTNKVTITGTNSRGRVVTWNMARVNHDRNLYRDGKSDYTLVTVATGETILLREFATSLENPLFILRDVSVVA